MLKNLVSALYSWVKKRTLLMVLRGRDLIRYSTKIYDFQQRTFTYVYKSTHANTH